MSFRGYPLGSIGNRVSFEAICNEVKLCMVQDMASHKGCCQNPILILVLYNELESCKPFM